MLFRSRSSSPTTTGALARNSCLRLPHLYCYSLRASVLTALVFLHLLLYAGCTLGCSRASRFRPLLALALVSDLVYMLFQLISGDATNMHDVRTFAALCGPALLGSWSARDLYFLDCYPNAATIAQVGRMFAPLLDAHSLRALASQGHAVSPEALARAQAMAAGARPAPSQQAAASSTMSGSAVDNAVTPLHQKATAREQPARQERAPEVAVVVEQPGETQQQQKQLEQKAPQQLPTELMSVTEEGSPSNSPTEGTPSSSQKQQPGATAAAAAPADRDKFLAQPQPGLAEGSTLLFALPDKQRPQQPQQRSPIKDVAQSHHLLRSYALLYKQLLPAAPQQSWYRCSDIASAAASVACGVALVSVAALS